MSKSTKSRATNLPRALAPKATGRPPISIDEDQLRTLARMNCTNAEMAAVLKCSPDTLERRFAATIKAERDAGCASLRRSQWKLALAGHPTLLIWLGKQHLGQKDVARQELTGPEGEGLPVCIPFYVVRPQPAGE